MKVRKGFVSNSSSSSFIVNATSTKEIAIKMMEFLVKREDEDSFFAEKKKIFDENIKKVTDLDTPIYIPWTCNYETYIWKKDKDNFIVDTCNNHGWWESDLDIGNSAECLSDLIDEEYTKPYDYFFDVEVGSIKNEKTLMIENYGGSILHTLKYAHKTTQEEFSNFIKSIFKKVGRDLHFIIVINKDTNDRDIIVNDKFGATLCAFNINNYWDISDIIDAHKLEKLGLTKKYSIMEAPRFSMREYFEQLIAYKFISIKD